MGPSALILLIFLIQSTLAQTTEATLAQDPTPPISPVSIVFCLVLLLVGACLAFYGFRWFKFTLFITGFTVFADLGLTILLLVLPPTKTNSFVGIVYLFTLLLGGLFGGTLLFCLKRRATSLIGVLGAFTVARLIRCAFPLLVVWAHVLLLVGLIIVGLVCTRYFERSTVILSTSVSGAFIMMVGVDLIAANGLVFSNVGKDGQGNIVVSMGAWMELGGIVLITIVAAVFQFWKHKGHFGDGEPERIKYQNAKNPLIL